MIFWIYGLALLFAIVTFNLPLIAILLVLGCIKVEV
jgi:hypothetical protein